MLPDTIPQMSPNVDTFDVVPKVVTLEVHPLLSPPHHLRHCGHRRGVLRDPSTYPPVLSIASTSRHRLAHHRIPPFIPGVLLSRHSTRHHRHRNHPRRPRPYRVPPAVLRNSLYVLPISSLASTHTHRIPSVALRRVLGLSMLFCLIDGLGGLVNTISLVFRPGPFDWVAAANFFLITVFQGVNVAFYGWFEVIRKGRGREFPGESLMESEGGTGENVEL